MKENAVAYLGSVVEDVQNVPMDMKITQNVHQLA